MNELAGKGVFICGHPKSGTSLLMTLLDSHPQLLVYPEESAYFRRFCRVTTGLTIEEKIQQADHHLLHMFEWDAADPPPSQAGFPDRDYTAFSYGAVKKAFRTWMEKLGFEERALLPAALFAYGEVSGQLTDNIIRWVEKTPYNERYSYRIFTLWPDARCIHVIRDPRDNYTSYRRKHPDWTPNLFAYSWRGSTVLAERNQARFGKERYLILRFEDLLSDPENVLLQIREFLEIEDHEILRQPTRAGRQWGGNSMFGDKFSQVSQTPMGRWKDSLDIRSLEKIEAALNSLMTRWGYIPESKPGIYKNLSWIGYMAVRKLTARRTFSRKFEQIKLDSEDD